MAQSRSIFEDVNETTKPTPEIIGPQNANPKSVRIWLWIIFALIVILVFVGGATRLTDSGLSITEWDLFTGFLPPMNESAWAEQFARYQQTEEFKQINYEMTVDSFQSIFWWEWIHRLLGRVIGLVWIIGFAFFAIRKKIRRDRFIHIIYIGAMIALQGVVGILMVKSGYVGDRTDVASYALAAHLGMAFIILAMQLECVLQRC